MHSSAAKFFLFWALLVGLLSIIPSSVSAATVSHPTVAWSTAFSHYPTIKISTPQPVPAPSAALATSQPTPTRSISPIVVTTPSPKPSTSPVNSTMSQDYLMTAINSYRAKFGLTTVQTDPSTCSFAKTRAQEISTAFNHNGFTSRLNSKTLPYPSYRLVTENIAINSSYKNVVNSWINSPAHAQNMRSDTPYVCIEKYGNYYAFEGWKP